MLLRFLIFILIAAPLTANAYDKEVAERIYKKCALCHSHNGQGVPGGRYPRIAGMDTEYMVQALKDFQSGVRWDTAMSVISGLPDMTEEEMQAVAKYIAAINLDEREPTFDVKAKTGDKERGAAIFKDDCKTCHGKKAQGKKRKGAPFLAGQHTEYIHRQFKLFKARERLHDRDEEDETFDDYSQQDLQDIVAFLASLDDHPVVATPGHSDLFREKARKGDHVFNVSQTVLKMPLEPGVSADDARQAMISKAVETNLKVVSSQIIHRELRERGVKTGVLEIHQFCDPEDAMKMVRHNPLYAAYMPCRIALVEDTDGKLWVTMLNLDFLIENWSLPEELRTIAININGKMLDIISAATTGEF